jgi:lipoprotein NlpI
MSKKRVILEKQSLFVILFFGLMATSEFVWATGKPAASGDTEKCYKSTNPDVAINYCTQTIESRQLSGKSLAFAFYKRGNAYYGKGDHDRAILDYDQAIRLNPSHANSHSNRGAAYARKGDYDRAIQDYDEAIRLNPNHANAFSNRGVAYGHKGDYDRAIQDYDQAVRLNPNYVNAFYNRGNAYRRKGDYERAVLNYDQVIRLNPKHVNAYSNRGLARFYQGQFTAAVPDFSKAIEFTPTDLYRILLLYVAQARAGSDARDGLEQATKGLDLKEWPGPIVSMYLGKIPDHVVFDAVADADPIRERQKRCQAYFYVVQRLLIRQNHSEAARMFRETVATNASTLFEYEGAQIELKHLGNTRSQYHLP